MIMSDLLGFGNILPYKRLLGVLRKLLTLDIVHFESCIVLQGLDKFGIPRNAR